VNATLRIGDAEREEAARELGEHFALGRITADEHSDRLEQVWAARTSADLAPVFHDLPRPRPEKPAPSRGERVRSLVPRLPYLPFPFRVLCFVVLFILAWKNLPLVVVALLIYVLAVRRAMRRRKPPWQAHGHWH
jgi:Domain of unknown function (DUF1707)